MFNEYKFEDVYGVPFGTRGKISEYPDRDNNEFEIEFTTPNNSEEDVRFEVGMMTYVYFKDQLELQILDGGDVLYESNRAFSMFVNKDGVDPKAGKPTGHPGIAPPDARDTHLLPNHTYKLRVSRSFGASANNPISITYYATDDNQIDYGSDIEGVPMTFNGVTGMFVPE